MASAPVIVLRPRQKKTANRTSGLKLLVTIRTKICTCGRLKEEGRLCRNCSPRRTA